MSKQRIGAAVIGTGFGVSGHVMGYRTCENVEVVALAGANAAKTQRLAQELGIPNATTSLDEVLKLPGVDVVSIATPTGRHAHEAMAALHSGKHVIVEKPMAVNVAEAEAMLAAAEASHQFHVVNTELRFNPTRVRLKQLVDEGYLGRVYHVAVHSYQDYRSLGWNWRAGADHGMTRANGAHLIDLVRWIFGEIDGVVAGLVETMEPTRPEPSGVPRAVECDDFSSFTLRLARGGVALCALSGVASLPKLNSQFEPGHMRVEAFGEKGALLLDLDDRLYGTRRGEPAWTDFTVEDLLLADSRIPRRVWELGTVRLLQRVVAAIRGEQDLGYAATFRDGLAATRVIDAALAYYAPIQKLTRA